MAWTENTRGLDGKDAAVRNLGAQSAHDSQRPPNGDMAAVSEHDGI
jgi:hypothetical protein